MVLSTQWYDTKVFRSSSGFPIGLGTQILVTNIEAGLILTTLYVFPSNFGPSKVQEWLRYRWNRLAILHHPGT